MKFNQINHIILLGGSRILLELTVHLIKFSNYRINVFTSERQLNDVISKNGNSLRIELNSHSIDYVTTEDINSCSQFLEVITTSSLAIGMGEDWSFKKEIIQIFDGRLIDLMGVRLPQYRGGAHYTWQILRGNRIGACNLQLINEQMIQGVFDSGKIIKFKEYLFPDTVRLPEDYFEYATSQEINFIKEFFNEVKEGVEFEPFVLQENFSLYFPRLNTLKNAFLDWSWSSLDIEKMICAFDTPYPGVATFINDKLVRLKKAQLEYNEGPFHPFQRGLIYKIYNEHIYVCSKDGTIIVKEVIDEDGNNIINLLEIGDRFFTPTNYIESGLTTKIKYE